MESASHSRRETAHAANAPHLATAQRHAMRANQTGHVLIRALREKSGGREPEIAPRSARNGSRVRKAALADLENRTAAARKIVPRGRISRLGKMHRVANGSRVAMTLAKAVLSFVHAPRQAVKASASHTAGKFPPQEGGQRPSRKEWKPREDARPFERKEWKPRRDDAGEGRREFRPRPAAGSKSFSKPYRSRTGDQRPAGKFPPRDRDQQGPPRREWKPRTEGEGEARREFRPRRSAESTERRTFKPRPSSGGASRPRREGGGFSGRPKPAGERGSFAKRPFENREGSDRKKPPQRERRAGGQRGLAGAKPAGKPFSKPGGKSGGKFGASKGGKKSTFGPKRSGRPGSKPSFGKRPHGKKKSGK